MLRVFVDVFEVGHMQEKCCAVDALCSEVAAGLEGAVVHIIANVFACILAHFDFAPKLNIKAGAYLGDVDQVCLVAMY